MIIDALNKYYEILLSSEDSGVSRPGYSKAKVAYAIVLSKNGELLRVVDLRNEKGKPKDIDVPEQVIRTGTGVKANFMCDNCTYILGVEQRNKNEDKERIRNKFKALLNLHEEILGLTCDEGAIAVLEFLKKWNIDNAYNHPQVAAQIEGLAEGGNLVFRLDGSEGYIHERSGVITHWNDYSSKQESGVVGQCSISGEETSIARLHPSIKGVTGAQPSGASLVSFNLDAFTSYGKTQSYNAPIGENVAFAYTTTLNYLLRSEKHRMRIADTTTVFWAERLSSGMEENLLSALFFPVNEDNKKDDAEQNQVKRDPQTVKLIKDIFSRIKAGKRVSEALSGIDPNVNFYILGLAPNASRLSVRFWHVDKYGRFLDKVSQHYSDLAIEKSFPNEPDFISISHILKETAPLGDSKRIPPLLGGVLMRAILTGMPYPQVLYNSIISRIRADRNVNYVRASVIKACLARNQRFYNKGKGVNITMALDEQSTNAAYRLGRLFALLEKAQQDANPGLNATIKDRYFGAASATPGSVFPILLRLAQHHIAKSEYGRNVDKRIEEVVSEISVFPSHLNLEEQGLFVLGYYHQRQAIFKKNESKEV